MAHATHRALSGIATALQGVGALARFVGRRFVAGRERKQPQAA
jgi:hypothetical protein